VSNLSDEYRIAADLCESKGLKYAAISLRAQASLADGGHPLQRSSEPTAAEMLHGIGGMDELAERRGDC